MEVCKNQSNSCYFPRFAALEVVGGKPWKLWFDLLYHGNKMKQEEYMQQRVEDQIEWYSRKASLNKNWYIRLEVIAIVLSVSIPFVSNFMTANTPWVKHIVSLMGVLIAAISGLVGLMKYRDNWVEYRTTAELLRHERYMFLTKSGAYSGGKRFDTFVQTIENLLSSEIAKWKNYQTAPTDTTPVTSEANETPTEEVVPPAEASSTGATEPVYETTVPTEEPAMEEAPASEEVPAPVEDAAPVEEANPEDTNPAS